MQLYEIFEKDVAREIEGVIKAGDRRQITTEIDEFVITTELAGHLSNFLEAYNDKSLKNGAWISGFFGSGKSHLLKMLALLLENERIDGEETVLNRFLPKCGDNALLKASMRKAALIPSKSILFNIDQKADVIKKTDSDAVLGVFLKVFNEACGYYPKQGYVAQMERHLDEEGLLNQFKDLIMRRTGQPWEKVRDRIQRYTSDIDIVYGEVIRQRVEGIAQQYRDDFSLSIEDFADLVSDYLEKQGPDFRLNFLIDEVGQYVADHTKLMTNLQTIAEALNIKCGKRSWLIVTAQEEMDSVLGELGGQQTDDFSKIQDRFSVRLKLTSSNVEEVIHERLIRKKEDAREILAQLYEREHNNFRTMFSFIGCKRNYPNFRDRNHFIRSYPFIPYQYDLFQAAIKNLSKQNAFEGKHQSVGERSMLSVFQDVLKSMADSHIEDLATFDRMFEGIRTMLKSSQQDSILTAEKNMVNPLAIRVLKALFLVKYVKEFRADLHNISILLTESFTQNVSNRETEIKNVLDLLEQESFVQRNGDLYEYLTDEEKDVEREIKNTEIEFADIKKFINEIIFNSILKERKIRYKTGQDFAFSQKIDDSLYSREQELSINIISPLHDLRKVSNMIQRLKMQNAGKSEMLIVLPADDRLLKDLYQYKKTEKYIRQNTVADNPPVLKHILRTKGEYNLQLRTQLESRLKDSIKNATIIVSGDIFTTNQTEPQSLITEGFHALIERIYTDLKHLNGVKYDKNMITDFLGQSESGTLGIALPALNESERDVEGKITLLSSNGTRVTVKHLLEEFGKRPYGWPEAATLCILAKLQAISRIAILSDANEITGNELAAALKNSRLYGNLIVRKEENYSPQEIQQLKSLYREIFDQPAKSREAKPLAQETKQAFGTMATEIRELLKHETEYPFLKALHPLWETVSELAKKPSSYFLKELVSLTDSLLSDKIDILDPIKQFMAGPMGNIYRNAKELLKTNAVNLEELNIQETEKLEQILESPTCYKGTAMAEAKTLIETLKRQINEHVQKQRKDSSEHIQSLANRIRNLPAYTQLSDEQKQRANDIMEGWNEQLRNKGLIPVIRDFAAQIENREYPALLDQIEQWAKTGHAKMQPGENKEQTVAPLKSSISSRDIHIPFTKPYLETEKDVLDYLEATKKEYLEKIKNGKRIQI